MHSIGRVNGKEGWCESTSFNQVRGTWFAATRTVESGRMRKMVAISLVAICYSMAGSMCAAEDEVPANGAPQEQDVVTTPAPVAGKHELFHKYVENTLGPEGMLGAALDAGLALWQNAPPEWDRGANGYAQRWASAYAQSAIGDATKYAVARLLHQDPSYQRCQCTGFGPRLAHAVSSPFKARNREGDWVWSPAVGASIVASHMIPAATWYPSDNGTRDGLQRTGTALLSKIGVRVFREFVHIPQIFQ
jgi:hypothetical protein